MFREEITRRRALLITPFAFAALVALSSRRGEGSKTSAASKGADEEVAIVEFDDAAGKPRRTRVKKVIHSDAEWQKLLDREQFYVTRREGTDMAFTGTYYKMHDRGIFRCVCCANALFSSDAKFDSGTGWPSFWAPIAEENVGRRRDTSLLMERTEVHCTRCDAHLGHVFEDGPPPTGLRYCINESALRFVARAS